MQRHGLKYIFSLFSANALQIGFSQLGGLFLFWLASKELSKTDFGDFNWYFAVYGTLIAVFSFGFDFIVIKRISAKNDIDTARIQFIQSLTICALALIPVLFIIYSGLFSTQFKETLFILVSFQFTYLSMPFKNALTGKELFSKSAQAVIISNSIKIALILTLYFVHKVTLFNVSIVLAISNFTELLFYIINSYKVFEKIYFSKKINLKLYKELLKESLPQLGVIIFDSAFARIDWILLGVLSTTNAAVNTAEYSFAYKIFELSKLPLLILAPILFTRFSKLFYNPANITNEVSSGVYSFFKIELLIGMMIPLLINIAWVPLMLFFTDGKYGPENAHIYFLLSLTIPIIYMINFLWTIAFAQGQLKLTMTLSIINSILNILLNVVLIPLYGQTGAALSFLICNVVMFPVYLYFVNQTHIKFPFKESIIVIAISLVIGISCYFIPLFFIFKCCICLLLYILVVYGLKILKFAEIKTLKHFINKS